MHQQQLFRHALKNALIAKEDLLQRIMASLFMKQKIENYKDLYGKKARRA